MSKKDAIKRLEEGLTRFPPESDMYAEIERQLTILRHPVFAPLSVEACKVIGRNRRV